MSASLGRNGAPDGGADDVFKLGGAAGREGPGGLGPGAEGGPGSQGPEVNDSIRARNTVHLKKKICTSSPGVKQFDQVMYTL